MLQSNPSKTTRIIMCVIYCNLLKLARLILLTGPTTRNRHLLIVCLISENQSCSGMQDECSEKEDQEVQYNNHLKHHLCLCVQKNTALWGVVVVKYSPQLCLVLNYPLNMPPCAAFSIHTCGSALNIRYAA